MISCVKIQMLSFYFVNFICDAFFPGNSNTRAAWPKYNHFNALTTLNNKNTAIWQRAIDRMQCVCVHLANVEVANQLVCNKQCWFLIHTKNWNVTPDHILNRLHNILPHNSFICVFFHTIPNLCAEIKRKRQFFFKLKNQSEVGRVSIWYKHQMSTKKA